MGFTLPQKDHWVNGFCGPFSLDMKKDMIWLNIDHRHMGVGGDNTWGAQVHPEYTITPHEWQYSFTMQPLSNQDDAAEKAHKKWF
jgi:beta-galactosidase